MDTGTISVNESGAVFAVSFHLNGCSQLCDTPDFDQTPAQERMMAF
jgi:hypothetical protein